MTTNRKFVNMLIINFGHALNDKAKEMLKGAKEVHLPFVLDMKSDPYPQMVKALHHVKEVLQQHNIVDNNFYVIMPGLTTAAVFLAAGLQGLTGSLPNVITMVKDEDELFLPDFISNLQKFREEIRKVRDGNAVFLG